MGVCYSELGDTARAIGLFEQALAISREVADRKAQASHLSNLGNCYSDLGDTARAIGLYEQALAIAWPIGSRLVEAMNLIALADAHRDLELWDIGVGYCQKAIKAADAIGSTQAQSGAHRSMAQIQLLAGDLPAAKEAISAARDYNYPRDEAKLSLMSGIAQLRLDQPTSAGREFHAAIIQADRLIEQASAAYQALDIKALALCGLALTNDPNAASDASMVFLKARRIISADGIVKQNLALFNVLAVADRSGIIAGPRAALEGKRKE
jgi:tetratricopeptide (TPR) repeat protein